MPRKKISLEEAYAVFEQHGLQVEISGIAKPEEPAVPQSALFERPYGMPEKPEGAKRVGKSMVRIALHTKQTMTSGGNAVYSPEGKLIRIDGQESVTYGPGVVIVPAEIAGDLQHQDQLAQKADANLFNSTFKSYVIVSTPEGQSVAKLASTDQFFDMSGFLGQLGNSGHALQLPF
jgi:hypothetical protein